MGKLEAPYGGIQGGKEAVFGEHIGVGEGVHERGFARIGVADERYPGNFGAMFALGGALSVEFFQFLLEDGDAVTDEAPVGFDLSFPRTFGSDASFFVVKGESRSG